MNSHITITDVFKSDIVDHDIIVSNKSYFNIYNNSLDEPFHKFWFYIENAKLMNMYNENSIFRFALNNKNEKIKKLIDYLKKLFEYLQILFNRTYPDISFEIPWKEYDKYPYLMNFFVNDNTICLDSNQNSKNHIDIIKDITCSVLFELTYIQVMKIISDDKTSYSLKFKFNLIMVQEKAVDIKMSLLENINHLNNPKLKINPVSVTNPIISNLTEIAQGVISIPKNTSPPAIRLSLNPNVLLNKLNTLNKIDKKEKDIKIVEDDKNIPEYLEQKNKLKKVETDERTLIPILKKEFEEMTNKHENKNINITKNNINESDKSNEPNELNELDKMDELDELDKLDLRLENLSSKTSYNNAKNNLNSISTTQIIDKKMKKIIKKSDTKSESDLEFEFENIAKK